VSPKKVDCATKNNETTSELIENKKKLIALINRAQDGDEEALPALRRVLDEAPRIARFVDLARNVERSIVKRMAGDDVFTQEAIPRNLKVMRQEKARPLWSVC
jgi:ribonuclease D